MKTMWICLIALFVFPMYAGANTMPDKSNEKSALQVVVLTGGHGFETEPFYEMFRSFESMQIDHAQMDETCTYFDDISDWKYDVIVFYHYARKISDQSRQNLISLCDRGIGIVVLHHAIAGFPKWDEWKRIIGAIYFLEDTEIDGTLYKRCTYRHDVTFQIHIQKNEHPVCSGIRDFEIHDETYNGLRLEPQNDILLTTGEPTSQHELAWTRKYSNSRVFFLQLGHDHYAFENPNYRKLVANGIRWTGQKSIRAKPAWLTLDFEILPSFFTILT